MAKQKVENGTESAQTHEWLTMSEAAARFNKSQATIRNALHKHSAFISGENWREIRPTLRFPDGTERPGSGRGNIVVRADALEAWVTSTPERVPGRRVAGTVYKINVRDGQLDDITRVDARNAADGLTTEMSFHDAIVALLEPFDVNMRKANVRKPQDESPAEESQNGNAMHDLVENTDPDRADQFEFELVEG